MKAIGLDITNLNLSDLDRLKLQTSSYILEEPRFIKFVHPSYEEGIFSEIEKNYSALVEKVAFESPWLKKLLEDRVETHVTPSLDILNRISQKRKRNQTNKLRYSRMKTALGD